MTDVKQLVKDKASQEKETVKVVIRCRPLSSNEMAQGHEVVVKMNCNTGEIMIDKPQSDEPPK
jgi:hypothetical protein